MGSFAYLTILLGEKYATTDWPTTDRRGRGEEILVILKEGVGTNWGPPGLPLAMKFRKFRNFPLFS